MGSFYHADFGYDFALRVTFSFLEREEKRERKRRNRGECEGVEERGKSHFR